MKKVRDYIDDSFKDACGDTFRDWLVKRLVNDLTFFDDISRPEQIEKAKLLYKIYKDQ